MSKVLTSRFVETVKQNGKRVEYPDASLPGFALRVSAEGYKSFTYRYRENRKQKRKTWNHPAYTLAEARGEAEGVARAVGRGESPKNASEVLEAVGDLCDVYVTWLKGNVRRWKAAEGEINNHVRPHIGSIKLEHIVKKNIREMIEAIPYPVAKNRALSRCRAMFNWAIDNDLSAVDPTHGIKKPTKEKPRGKILTDEELGKIWRGCDKLESPAREYFKFVILCGQRRDDVRLMPKTELRGEDWVISAERYKGKRDHLVPMTEGMIEIIKTKSNYEHLFSVDGEKPYSNLVKPKRTLDKASEVQGWTIHDIRRTFRTGLSRIGIRPDVAERVIGHSVGGKLGETYDLYSYREEKLEALKKWGAFLKSL